MPSAKCLSAFSLPKPVSEHADGDMPTGLRRGRRSMPRHDSSKPFAEFLLSACPEKKTVGGSGRSVARAIIIYAIAQRSVARAIIIYAIAQRSVARTEVAKGGIPNKFSEEYYKLVLQKVSSMLHV